MHLQSQIQHLLNDKTVKITEELQSLWSGYGSIIRCKSRNNQQSFIVKLINVNNEHIHHPRGWNTTTSHLRKVKSYQVESDFYRHYLQTDDDLCKTPTLFAASDNLIVNENNHAQILIMEDLDDTGYFIRKQNGDWKTTTLVIKWLANFHARFMHTDSEKLWQQGGYWHLATRQDEYNAMPECSLKSYATQIDKTLSASMYKTLIHGDAKLENMCFHRSGKQVAAVDFQYVGKGAGIIDLAYFMGSAFHQQQLFKYHDQALNLYLSELKNALLHYKKIINWQELENEYRHLYPQAWADFHRFLMGWNPKSWKINDYLQQQSDIAIEQL